MLINKEDRFYIAGHRGMVGSALCRQFRRKGYENLLTASRDELDLLDVHAVQDWFNKQRPTVVLLAAAKVGGIYANETYPADFLLENLKIQTNVIETAWRSGVRRFLFLGSSCIYPKFAEQPIKEQSLLTGALEQTNECYAIAKIAGLKLCESLRKQYGFDAISLMPTNLYGPGDNYHPQNSHVIPALIQRFQKAKEFGHKSVTCWGTGSPERDFLHVDDLGEACLFVLENWQPKEENMTFVNAGSGMNISIRNVAKIISRSVGFKGAIKWDISMPDGTPKKHLDISILKKLGWRPKIPLAQGIDETVKQFQLQNSLTRNDSPESNR